MNLSLGIDIGSSSTKAAALDEHGTLLGTLQVHADDPRTSAYGVLGRFLDQQGASFDDVEKIVLTGLGSTYFHENIFGIPTIHALELDAIGHGAYTCPGLTKRWWSALEPALLYPRFQDKRLPSSGRKRCRRWNTCRHGGAFSRRHRHFSLSKMALRGNKAMADLRIATCRRKMSRDLPPT